MGQDALRSSMTANVVSGKEMPGGRVEAFDTGKPIPNLDSAMASVGFPNIDMGGVQEDIPGSLMTCLDPEETGSGALESSFGTPPISK